MRVIDDKSLLEQVLSASVLNVSASDSSRVPSANVNYNDGLEQSFMVWFFIPGNYIFTSNFFALFVFQQVLH